MDTAMHTPADARPANAPARLRQTAHRLNDLGGTLSALESGLFSDAGAGSEGLLDYCAGLRLVKDGLREIKDEIAALADQLAA